MGDPSYGPRTNKTSIRFTEQIKKQTKTEQNTYGVRAWFYEIKMNRSLLIGSGDREI